MDVIFWSSTFSNMGVMSRYVGPYKLKHWIKKSGYTSKVIDFLDFLTEEQLYNATKKYVTKDTLMLGISTTFLTNSFKKWSNGRSNPMSEHIYNAAKRIKSEFPNIKIVLGGYGCDDLFVGNIIDASMMSYNSAPEDILIEYLNHLKYDAQPPKHKIKFNFYNIQPEDAARIMPAPRPHFDEANEKKYSIEQDDFRFEKDDCILPGEALPMDISRGCIFACRFCNYPHLGKGKLDYIRGFEYVRSEMISNYEKFGTTSYMILDDTFNETEVKLKAFNDMVATLPFKINYSAYLRADLIDRFRDTAYYLQESGLWGAFHGLESLNARASNIVGKAWSGKHARDFIPELYHDIWDKKVPVHLNFIMGLPGENLEDVKNTIDWAQDIDIYNIGYERLGLVNPKRTGRFSILSEFDRNSEKWGFFFLSAEEAIARKLDHRIAWYNDTWQPEELIRDYEIVKGIMKRKKLEKATVWNLGNMQMMGYSKEFLVNTPREDYDLRLFAQRRRKTYDDYYAMLMNETI